MVVDDQDLLHGARLPPNPFRRIVLSANIRRRPPHLQCAPRPAAGKDRSMSIALALLKKVRCRFLCKESGAPVAGIVASLAIELGTSARSARVPVGTLCSDGAGYVSFDLRALLDRGVTAANRLFLTGPRLPQGEIDLLDILLKDRGAAGIETGMSASVSAIDMVGAAAADLCLVFPVQIPLEQGKEAAKGAGCASVTLPSVQSPDACDYRASPFSFVAPVAAKLGDGCCETLVPASLPIQEHRFFKVVVRRESGKDDLAVIGKSAKVKEVSVTDALGTQPSRLKFAEVLEFKQAWYSLGHSLGEIKYSLALAPGEATQVAVIDWSRQDSVSRSDSVLAGEFMDHSLRRDRSIEETIDSALRESQGGSSFMAGTSGQATIPLQSVTLSFNHAVGFGVTNSWGNRDLEAQSLQDLHDRIRQQSGYTRSLNSTVVVQATQAEQNVLQTRKVANHNHCHALTIQYYEVLRHYRISTRYAGRKKALLVPFKPFAFTWELALRLRSLLEPVLTDPSLRGCFDALTRLKAAPAVYDQPQGGAGTGNPPAPQPAPAPAPLTRNVTVYTYHASGVGSNISVKRGDAVRITATGQAFTGGLATFGPDGHTDPATSDFTAPRLRKFSLICKVSPQGSWQQAGAFAQIVADADGELVFNMNDIRNDYDNNRPLDRNLAQNDRWEVNVTYPSHEVAAPAPADPTPGTGSGSPASAPPNRAADELCTTRLLAHLNGNQGYYNGCVWVLQNPIERRLRLEAALSAHPDLLDALDDVPLAISGNYVAFAYDGPFVNWEAERASDPALPVEDIVTLPTRGVFAEAQLGHCNACEERDPTRMWDWKEMTIETPPEIGGVTPGPRGQTPAVTPAQLPGNVIQITQPPAAPDPAGLAAALKVLGTPDIFRDMSGLSEVSALLQKLSEQSSEANIKALAREAKDKLDQAKGAGAQPAHSGADKTRTPAGEADPETQVDRLKAIEYAKEKGLIDEEQQNDAAQGVLGGELLPAVQYGPTDGVVEAEPVAPRATTNALVGDPQGPLSLSAAVIDHLSTLGGPDGDSCVAASSSYFAQAMRKIGISMRTVVSGGTRIEVPAVATANGNVLSPRSLVTLWFSYSGADNWLRLPKSCRGAGAPGALLYADLIENRTLLTSGTGWPEGMLPGAHLQLWPNEATYLDVRDLAVEHVLGHSCIFNGYVQGDASRILVSDQGGIARALDYGWLGLRYVIAGNLSKARILDLQEQI
jgi:hypothetical protein